jgi:RimJ/RimL family protein N-acetyltransferase
VPSDPAFDSIRTDRLILRRFHARDVDAFSAYRSDPVVARYQSWDPPFTADEAISFVGSLASVHPGSPDEWFQFAIQDRATGDLIGDCGLRVDGRSPDVAELGFTLARDRQGRGFALEAVAAVLAYAADRLGVRRVVAVTDARNGPSIALLERLGMRHMESRTVRFKGERCEEREYRLDRIAPSS